MLFTVMEFNLIKREVVYITIIVIHTAGNVCKQILTYRYSYAMMTSSCVMCQLALIL